MSLSEKPGFILGGVEPLWSLFLDDSKLIGIGIGED